MGRHSVKLYCMYAPFFSLSFICEPKKGLKWVQVFFTQGYVPTLPCCWYSQHWKLMTLSEFRDNFHNKLIALYGFDPAFRS